MRLDYLAIYYQSGDWWVAHKHSNNSQLFQKLSSKPGEVANTSIPSHFHSHETYFFFHYFQKKKKKEKVSRITVRDKSICEFNIQHSTHSPKKSVGCILKPHCFEISQTKIKPG